ncbi:V-type ATP synthase subunit I domain-containing protein [Legionella tunisiensis]|uniref:hypothetical protein n=1 Tax=Legionella tunisiensis TaxID=1034944 RepID=UPI0012EA781D|nr:hypothetical protein [Legionella tunisiensis]
MVENKEVWKGIGLDPDLLPDASMDRVPATWRTMRDIHKPLDYKKYYTRIKDIVTNYKPITTAPPESQLLEMMVFLSQEKMPSKQQMKNFAEFVDTLQNFGLLKIEKNRNNSLSIHVNGKEICFSELTNYKELQSILLMYKVYVDAKQPWEKEEFVKVYSECEEVLRKLDSILQDKKKDWNPPAKDILDNIIKTIMQNISQIETREISLEKFKKSIELYSNLEMRLFNAPEKSRERRKSDILLDKIFTNIYNNETKEIDLVNLIDSINNQYDALIEERANSPDLDQSFSNEY